MLVRTEARRLKGVPAAYILGEFLAPDNAPCYVQDFIARAAVHELDYLCEADLFAAVPSSLDAGIRGRLTAFTGADRSSAEQDIDFLTGRLFRRSVLVRSRPAGATQPSPDPDRLRSLHVSSAMRLDAAKSTAETTVFLDQQARSVTIGDPAVGQAITRLAKTHPGTLPLDDLTRDSDPANRAQIAEHVRHAVLVMVMAGRAEISTLPLAVGQGDEKRPAAWPFARAEAASSQPWITTLRHTGVPALPVLKLLLPYLDGTRDHAALQAVLVDALQAGAIPLPEPRADQDAAGSDSLAAIAERYLAEALGYLSHQALLLANGGAPG
jgi:methyltransferase-like protein